MDAKPGFTAYPDQGPQQSRGTDGNRVSMDAVGTDRSIDPPQEHVNGQPASIPTNVNGGPMNTPVAPGSISWGGDYVRQG